MQVSGGFSFPEFLLANGEDIQFAIYTGLLALLIAAEFLSPGLARPADRRRRWPANFGLTALNVVLPALIPVTAIGAAVWASEERLGGLNMVAAPMWLAVAATLLVRSFVSYATHKWMHSAPLLWRLHRVHHSDTHLDVSTTVRFHPLEFVVQLAVLAPVVVLCGLTPWVLVLYEGLDVLVNVVSHSNLRPPLSIDRIVRWVFVTPDMHRIHHSSFQTETDSNYGAVFSFWDRLFGTYTSAPRGGYGEMELGLRELRGRKTTNWLWQLWSPAERWYADKAPATTALERVYAKPSEEERALRSELFGRG